MNATPLAITLACFGVIMIVIGCRHLWRIHTWGPAAVHIIGGLLLITTSVMLFVLFLNLSTYTTLRYQTPVAEISFVETRDGLFNVSLMRIPSGSLQVFAVSGDEWQIGLRTLSWQGWPRLLGMQTKVRLQEFSSRHEAEQRAVQLASDPGPALWAWAQAHASPGAIIVAGSLQSTPLPMADKARYRLLLTPTGVVAQAVNRSASTALEDTDDEP